METLRELSLKGKGGVMKFSWEQDVLVVSNLPAVFLHTFVSQNLSKWHNLTICPHKFQYKVVFCS